MTAPDSAGATQEHTGAEAAISEAIHLLSTTNDTALPEEAQALVKRAINLLEQAEETFLEAPAIKTYRVLAYHVDGPEDAVRMFIASVQENPDMWCYQVTDDKTGRKWLVDRQGSTREIRARTAIDADVPCHLPRWFNTAGICEHTDHDA